MADKVITDADLEAAGFKPVGEVSTSEKGDLDPEGFAPVGMPNKSAAVPQTPNQTSRLGQMGRGFMDPPIGFAQGALRLGDVEPPAFASDEPPRQGSHVINEYVRNRESQIARERGVDAEKLDWSRMAGNMLNPINWLGRGISGGMLGGAFQPVAAPDEDYVSEKLKQVAVGGAIGGAFKVVGAGVGKLGEWMAKNYPEALENKAVQIILKRFGQDEKYGGAKAKDAIKLVNEANKAGKPQVLGDTNVSGPNVTGLAGNVARAPGESSALARNFLEKRDAGDVLKGGKDTGALGRLDKDIAEHVNSGPSAYRMTEALIHSRSQGSTPLYAKSDSLQHIWSPRLDEFLQSPDVKRGLVLGWQSEQRNALAEGRPLSTTTLGIDLGIDGSVKLLDKPNMRLLDMAKRGLDAMIAEHRNDYGRLDSAGRDIQKLKQAFLSEIESLDKSGAYKAAREFWSGKTASMDAVKFGKSVFNGKITREEIEEELAGMAANDREFVRIGLADELRFRLGESGLSGDESKRLVNKNNWLAGRLKPIFKSEKDYDEFLQDVLAERAMFESKTTHLGGSQTQGRQAEEAYGTAEARQIMGWGRVGSDLLRGHLFRAPVDAWRLYHEIGMPRSKELNEAIAKILFSSDISGRTRVGRKLTGKLPTTAPNALPNATQRTQQAGVLAGPLAAAAESPSGPPQENSEGGNMIPKLASGGIVTKPTVAMIGERGPEAVIPLGGGMEQQFMQGLQSNVGQAHNRQESVLHGMEGAFGHWLQQLLSRFPGADAAMQKYGIPGFAEGGVVTEPTVAMLGEQGPEAVVPLEQPGAVPGFGGRPQGHPRVQPVESVLPPELSDPDQAAQAREAAAMRTQRAVQPVGGREQGGLTESLFDVAIPGRAAARSASQGEYGQAAVEAAGSALPFGAGKAASALASPIGKAVAASTAALTAMFMDTSEGAKLSPENLEKLRMKQEESKLLQQQRTQKAQEDKDAADAKAKRDVETARQTATTQLELEVSLAKIKSDALAAQYRIEEEHKAAEQKAAEETLIRNAEHNKMLHERPFREQHPDAALGFMLSGIALAAAIPAASQTLKIWSYNNYAKELARLDKAATEALFKGTTEEQQVAANRLAAAAAKQLQKEGKLERFPWLTQLAAPAFGVELSLLPEELDANLQASGTRAHDEAMDFFASPSKWGRQAIVGALGAGTGVGGRELTSSFYKTRDVPSTIEGTLKSAAEKQAAHKSGIEDQLRAYEQAEADRQAKAVSRAAKQKATREAKKKASEEPAKEPRKARVPRSFIEDIK